MLLFNLHFLRAEVGGGDIFSEDVLGNLAGYGPEDLGHIEIAELHKTRAQITAEDQKLALLLGNMF